ncbi:2Fe-2S iron-sulfur cluster-binding protein [Flavitalea sp.]|nr:2Fe-2S iron-sulfur cluster-binding protein [Flavitalea sp.]
MSIHFHRLAVADVRRETAECISVAFELPDEIKSLFQYQPGQNITVKTLINNEEVRRSYSICSGDHENELRIAVKEAPGGVFSSWANHKLIKGQFLDLLPPTGRFIVHPDRKNKKRYLAIAAGSGITPILSIISSILHHEPLSSFTLLYGNRNRASIIFRDQLDALKNRFMPRFALHHVLSREITDAEIYSGRITALKCEEMSANLIDFQWMDEIFICGPEAMIFEIKDWLLGRKITSNKIHYELFTIPVSQGKDKLSVISASVPIDPGKIQPGPHGPETTASTEIPVSDITVKLDGISFDFKLPFEGKTILEAALDQGADLPFSCKGGVCSTCRAKLVEGQVAMDLNYALEPEEVEAGFILCCQSHPLTKKVVIDYDQK